MITLAIVVAGVSLSAAALAWRKIVVPFDRLLGQADDLEHPEWMPDRARPGDSPLAMTQSLLRLSNAIKPSAGSRSLKAETHSTAEVQPEVQHRS